MEGHFQGIWNNCADWRNCVNNDVGAGFMGGNWWPLRSHSGWAISKADSIHVTLTSSLGGEGGFLLIIDFNHHSNFLCLDCRNKKTIRYLKLSFWGPLVIKWPKTMLEETKTLILSKRFSIKLLHSRLFHHHGYQFYVYIKSTQDENRYFEKSFFPPLSNVRLFQKQMNKKTFFPQKFLLSIVWHPIVPDGRSQCWGASALLLLIAR